MPSERRRPERSAPGCRRSSHRARRARVSVVALGLWLAGCQTPTVAGESPAYDPTRLTGGLLYRWALGATVAVYVDTTGAGAAGVDLPAAVARGLDAWRGSWRYDELRPVLTDAPHAADVVVQLAGAPALVDVSGCPDRIATGAGATVLCAAGDSARTLPLFGDAGAGHVKVAISVSAASAALDAIVAHELGHAFGIGGHSDVESDLMHAAPAVSAPSERDARTLRYVLHQPAALRL